MKLMNYLYLFLIFQLAGEVSKFHAHFYRDLLSRRDVRKCDDDDEYVHPLKCEAQQRIIKIVKTQCTTIKLFGRARRGPFIDYCRFW